MQLLSLRLLVRFEATMETFTTAAFSLRVPVNGDAVPFFIFAEGSYDFICILEG